MRKIKFKDGDSVRKRCVGIDVSKGKFTCCLCQSTVNDCHFYSAVKEFDNEQSGFGKLLDWVGKEVDDPTSCTFLMEHTGCYHESLAIYLCENGRTVYVVNAYKAKAFSRLQGQRTKTDKVDSKLLATMGCDSSGLQVWPKPDEKFLQLRKLSRFREQLELSRTQVLGQQEAAKNAGIKNRFILAQQDKLLAQLKQMDDEAKAEMAGIVDSDPVLKKSIENMDSIKGVGINTAMSVAAETLGFHQMTSAKQVTGYAGLDVRGYQSGTVDTKGNITKRGNSHIRKILFCPAMVATRYNPQLREDYLRICEKHPDHKRIGVVAIQRKLLCLMFSIWKSGKPWSADYGKKENEDNVVDTQKDGGSHE